MNYLIYVEHGAENLQFFLWHQDYVKRFTAAKTSDIVLAPEWTQAMEDEAVARVQKDAAEKMRREPKGGAAEIFKGTDFEKRDGNQVTVGQDPFSTPPQTASGQESQYTGTASNAISYRSQATEAFASAGAKQPCKFTSQRCRQRLALTIAT